MDVINEHLGLIASMIGSLSVVGGGLIWLYNILISKPRDRWREKREEERQKVIVKEIEKANEPLNHSINKLNEWLNESKMDRERLNEIAEKNTDKLNHHEKMINNHDDRLIVLETKNGLKYRERRD